MVPLQPYIFASGNHAGKCLEILMFDDYQWLVWYCNKYLRGAKSKNALHQHLDWIFVRGEKKVAKMLCPRCHQHPVTQLSVIGSDHSGYTISSYYSCCSQDKCREATAAMAIDKFPTFLPAKFSSINRFNIKQDRTTFANTLKEIFGFSGRLNRQKVFEFFKSDP